MVTDPLSIRCRYCGAQPGDPCINLITKQPLQRYPHPQRDTDAGKPRRPVVGKSDDDGVPW